MANAYLGTKLDASDARRLAIKAEWSAESHWGGVEFPREERKVATANRWVAGWCPARKAWVANSFSKREKVWRGWLFRNKEAMESFREFLSKRNWTVEAVA